MTTPTKECYNCLGPYTSNLLMHTWGKANRAYEWREGLATEGNQSLLAVQFRNGEGKSGDVESWTIEPWMIESISECIVSFNETKGLSAKELLLGQHRTVPAETFLRRRTQFPMMNAFALTVHKVEGQRHRDSRMRSRSSCSPRGSCTPSNGSLFVRLV